MVKPEKVCVLLVTVQGKILKSAFILFLTVLANLRSTYKASKYYFQPNISI